MTQKSLIIALLAQDLKHSQFLLGLDDLGLSASDKHSLEHFDIIAQLMRVPEGEAASNWARIYLTYMSESREVEIEHTTAPMLPFAVACYEDLTRALKGKNSR